VTPSEAAVPTARIEPAPHHWMPTPADSGRPAPGTPSDAVVAGSAGGAADVQERVKAAAQGASESSSATETPAERVEAAAEEPRSPATPSGAERAPESEHSGAAERRGDETDGGSESSPSGASDS